MKKIIVSLMLTLLLVFFVGCQAQMELADSTDTGNTEYTDTTTDSDENADTDVDIDTDTATDSDEDADDSKETISENENSTEYEFRNEDLLEQHYEKHGVDMGFQSEEEYEEAASDVVNNPEALHKTEAEDGDDVYYVEDTNEFVIVSGDGYIRTYFYPNDGIDYYNRQ